MIFGVCVEMMTSSRNTLRLFLVFAHFTISLALSWAAFSSDEFSPKRCAVFIKSQRKYAGSRAVSKYPDKCTVSTNASFIFFVGEPHTSSTLVGSILDSHPDLYIANELNAFKAVVCGKYNNRQQLFKVIYHTSEPSVRKLWTAGGYDYSIADTDQGKCPNRVIKGVGDKRAGSTSTLLTSLSHHIAPFLRQFSDFVQLPLRTIHIVRNPFDVAAHLMYDRDKQCDPTKVQGTKPLPSFCPASYNDLFNITTAPDKSKQIIDLMQRAQQLLKVKTQMIASLGPHVWFDMYAEDFILDPMKHIDMLCDFVNVDCRGPELFEWRLKVRAAVHNTSHHTADIYHWCGKVVENVDKMINDSKKCPECGATFGRYHHELKYIDPSC